MPISRSVLITGASSGIGASCAQHLAALGYRVYAGVRSPEALAALAQPGIVPLRLDVTVAAEWEQVVSRLAAECPEGLYALIGNAGSGYGGPVEYLPLESFRAQLEVNFFAVIQGIQACLPLLRRYGPGSRIVNISSINGRVVTPFLAPYCSSKFALEALSECLRHELGPDRIHSCLIQPGMVRTPIFAKSLLQMQQLRESLPEAAIARYGAVFEIFERVLTRAQGRGSPPEAVAAAVARALSAERPKLCYPVGKDAHLAFLLRRLLSDAQFEVLLKRLGVHNQAPQAQSEQQPETAQKT